ncbi:DUF4190 domain-containing protein [Glycomyces terrestris]|uniref:DUF4190 domain-containing protein n=1 Tax=Glycomyces terrestris TaxID=2493553 RepID=A0A426USK4_9ACTN|nr:DUF4190 domain-containing protein [Glycomyces terrestris]RRR96432.1 hypothetical protein EIW28_21570 [Glycomyces terrestris]
MTTYPPVPGPPEPERPDDEDRPWSPNTDSSPAGEPENAPFTGNEDGPATTPADFAEPRETPGAPPEGNPDGFADTGEGAPRSVSESPGRPPKDFGTPSPDIPGGVPPGPPPAGAGYSPYAAAPPPPPPPPYNGDGPLYAQQERNGLGKAALVLGIIAVALSFVPGLNAFSWPLGVLAIIFGAIGWSRANKGQATNRNAAIAGLVLGIVSFFTFCLIYVLIGAGTATYDMY